MIAIIRYNAGNIRSVVNALERLGVQAVLTDDTAVIRTAERVIFPGVGEAGSAMQYLRERGLDEVIRGLRQPVLGICLGMQLLASHSEENDTPCLGIVDEKVRLLPGQAPDGSPLKVPHIGWNTVDLLPGHPLFEGLPEKPWFYFVHSYAMEVGAHTLAGAEYGRRFSAAVQRGNFIGVQFHPEKSAAAGERLLQNFLKMKIT